MKAWADHTDGGPPEGVPPDEINLRRAALDLALAVGAISVDAMPKWWHLSVAEIATWMDQARIRVAHTARLQGEVERLEKLVYVPGVWKCAKCGLRLVSASLRVDTGAMAANNKPQDCANGCGPMWRVTERDAGNELIGRMEAMASKQVSQNHSEADRV